MTRARQKISKICEWCGEEFFPYVDTKGVFCSRECKNKSQRKGSLEMDGMKKCSSCLKIKPIKDFYKTNDTRFKDGYRNQCISCCEDTRTRREYNLTIEEFLSVKDSKCDICGSTRNLHLDHDHSTGKVRGTLCINCNTALGGFRDSPEILLKAVGYLEGY